MLNRLFTSLAIVSLVAVVAVSVLWWRSNHGHSDTAHLGADSTTRTLFYTLPGGRVAIHLAEHGTNGVQSKTNIYPLRSVLGGCLLVPALWAAVRLRRRLLPRPPGAELPALRSSR